MPSSRGSPCGWGRQHKPMVLGEYLSSGMEICAVIGMKVRGLQTWGFRKDFLEEVIFDFGLQSKSVLTRFEVVQTPFPISPLESCNFPMEFLSVRVILSGANNT